MADFETKRVKEKKRKLRSPHEEQGAPKAPRVDGFAKEQSERVQQAVQRERDHEDEEALPWRNLQLILLIQKKDLDIQSKVELAYNFVKSRAEKEGYDSGENFETLSISRLLMFLNNWIQSLLISSEKKTRIDEEPRSKVIGLCLDFRCWLIFKFCLEDSLKLRISLSLSRDLLRTFGCIARHALSLLNNALLHSKKSLFTGEGFELYNVVLDCVSLVLSSHGGVLTANLDLWILAVDAVLELVHKIYADNLNGGSSEIFVMQFSCLVFEPFAKFLRVHPCRKKGFRDFIDKLLEPLLHLVSVLHVHLDGCNSGWRRELLNLVEEVLSYGLFHPTHIDGFLSIHSTEKYGASHDGKPKNTKTVIVSYHRHLFDRLEKIMAGKKVLALGGIGDLLHVFADRVRRQKGVSVLSESSKMIGREEESKHLEDGISGNKPKMFSGNGGVFLKTSSCTSSFDAQARRAIFDFFVLIMEPLLLEINIYVLDKLEVGATLLDFNCILGSINKILGSFMREKAYMRIEDTTDGACLSFLKVVYDTIMSFSMKINQMWLPAIDDNKATNMEILNLIAKEIITAVGYFLQIEYEVMGNDLVSLWLMMFLYLIIDFSSMGSPENCLLTSHIVDLGCQLVNLYSELRQVNDTIFGLCKAVRLLILHECGVKTNDFRFISSIPSLSYEACARSVGMLMCSREFRLAIYNAIQSVPEGQAGGCIRELTTDISESLEWIKSSCSVNAPAEFGELNVRECSMPDFDLLAEVLGRVLSEMYTLILDSLIVTVGNSNVIGVSMKGLMAVIRPSMSSLVTPQPDCVNVNEFLFYVLGRTSNNVGVKCKSDILKLGCYAHWVFLFFFRLYLSCRSLYRQAICLVPPDTSKKMSALLGDTFTAYSGKDLMERTDCADEGYFFWIAQPSISLLAIIQSVLDSYVLDCAADCSPLVYVLHAMALQRLVDLNRQIKSFEYLMQRDDQLVKSKLRDDGRLLGSSKKSKRWRRCISNLREEAEGLANFMMGYLPLVVRTQSPIFVYDDATSYKLSAKNQHESSSWDFSICAVNRNSLPTAVWWIICRNIDVWCTLAAKKKLNMFLSLLISSSFEVVGLRNIHEAGHLRKITIHQTSLELLRDTVLYEQRFVCRRFTSRFCRNLEKLIFPIFCDSLDRDSDFNSPPNWQEVLSALDKSSVLISSSNNGLQEGASVAKLSPYSYDKWPEEDCEEPKAFPVISKKITACQSLLNFLCWMPKGNLSSRSFSLCLSFILNLERLVVGSLLNRDSTLYLHNRYELLRLFVTCRKALRYIAVASCEERLEGCQSSLAPIMSGGPLTILWLLKSVYAVVGLHFVFSDDSEIKDLIFSLLDHTSYMFLTLSKACFSTSVHYLLNAKKPNKEQLDFGIAHEQSNLTELNSFLDPAEDINALKSVVLLAKTLKEQIPHLLNGLKDFLCYNAKEGVVSVMDFSKLSSVISCIQGFLWGLASTLKQMETEKGTVETRLFRWKCDPSSELRLCLDTFAESIYFLLCVLLFEDEQQSESVCDVQSFHKLDFKNTLFGVEESSLKDSADESYILNKRQQCKSGAESSCSASYSSDDISKYSSVWKKILHLCNADCVSTSLTDVDSFEQPCLNKLFLRRLLKCENPEAAFLLRQLFIALSAVLRLDLLINSSPLSSRLVPAFVGVSEFLLLEFSEMVAVQKPFSFVWLDGVLKYLEELGSHLYLINPALSRNMYVKLVGLHLRAIGRCISLQGKRATLASHGTESSTKTLGGMGFCEPSLTNGSFGLDEFKTRLRTSFKEFIKKPPELHLLSAVQAIERALVGVQEGCTMIYHITTGSSNAGRVSSFVAAGIECLDLVLEFVSGRKCLNVVKRHIQSLIAGLFNIVMHLHSPHIFGKLVDNTNKADPDSGSVILMCVEVLTRVSGRHALFQMDSCHVAQSLRIPAMLFRDFHQLKPMKTLASSDSLLSLDISNFEPVANKDSCIVDRKFSIELYAACCRLLYTVLKHHKSDCERCVALLEDSVCVLLHSLEMGNTVSGARRGDFAWKVQEGVKCASYLRRIYEEIRQQKDIFGQHAFKFLSNYIWIYSGYGPLKTGIKREIDEALRPGVYALIDACSADNLQYLHTVFGEGPCRNSLATLLHDYKLNFQYEGKV